MVQTFDQITYTRPDFNDKCARFEEALSQFINARSAPSQSSALSAAYAIRADIESADMLNRIRLAQSSSDKELSEERRSLDQLLRGFQSLVNRLHVAISNSPYRHELGETWGSRIFDVAELTARFANNVVADDLVKESELILCYETLLGHASCTLGGERHTLAGLRKKLQDKDRKTRLSSHAARIEMFTSLYPEIKRIYSELVALRNSMARRLGYSSFTPMAYDRMLRTGYGPKEIREFRENISLEFSPLVNTLEEQRATRLGVDSLIPADEGIVFREGNPRPRVTGQNLVSAVADIFQAFAPETSQFFRTMVDAGMLDVEARHGKAQGGFCEALHDRGLPFLFANFNGTSHDVDVLVHEGGHAFQYFLSRGLPAIDLRWPSMEAAETSAMTMELLMLDQMQNIFGPDADRYAYSKLYTNVLMMPYRCSIDAFQEAVYSLDNPDFDKLWRDTDQHFRPYRPTKGDPIREQGAEWIMQRHLFGAPFYFIDYNIADICAIRIWDMYQSRPISTWSNFVAFCKLGGTLEFSALEQKLKLPSVFSRSSISKALSLIHI